MRRQAHGFFYALIILVGGVIGGESLADLVPLCQPGTSSTAQCLTALDGGLQHQTRSTSS